MAAHDMENPGAAKNRNSGVHRTEFVEQLERTRRRVSKILRSIPRRRDERSIERYMQFELLSPPGSAIGQFATECYCTTEFARGVPIGIALNSSIGSDAVKANCVL